MDPNLKIAWLGMLVFFAALALIAVLCERQSRRRARQRYDEFERDERERHLDVLRRGKPYIRNTNPFNHARNWHFED